jgi:hypothetical protein
MRRPGVRIPLPPVRKGFGAVVPQVAAATEGGARLSSNLDLASYDSASQPKSNSAHFRLATPFKLRWIGGTDTPEQHLTAQLHRRMKPKNFLIIAAFFATVVVCFPLHTEAAPQKAFPSPHASSSADADASPATAATASGKMRATSFKGIIAAVDDKAKTFTIAGKENSHVLKITDKTIITKGGQPATMKDVVANEEVRGSCYKMPDGSVEAKLVKLGPLTDAEKAEREARRAKREERKATISPAASASPSVTPSA